MGATINVIELENLLRDLARAEEEDTEALVAAAVLDTDPDYLRLKTILNTAEKNLNEVQQMLTEFKTAHPAIQRRTATQTKIEQLRQQYKDSLKQYAAENGSKKPFQGSGLAVYPDGDVQITDEDAALWWLKINLPICLKIDMTRFRKFAPLLKEAGLPWLKVADAYRPSIPDLTPWKAPLPDEWIKIVYAERQVDPVTGEISE